MSKSKSKGKSPSKAARNNRANQLNPNNPAYWSVRGSQKPTTKAPAKPKPPPAKKP